MTAILNSIVSNSYYGMLSITKQLFETMAFKLAAVSVKTSIVSWSLVIIWLPNISSRESFQHDETKIQATSVELPTRQKCLLFILTWGQTD